MSHLLLLWSVLGAPGVWSAQEAGWSETRFHRVYLRNGSVIDGNLIEDTPTMVVLKVTSGEFGIRKDQIARDEEGRLRVTLVKTRSYKEAPPVVPLRFREGSGTTSEPLGASPGEEAGAPPTPPARRPTRPAPRVPERVKAPIDLAILQWQKGHRDVEEDLVLAGKQGAPYLRWLVQDSGDPQVPLEPICRAVARLEGEGALEFLAKVMEMKESKERRAGIMGLSLITQKEAIPLLVRALEDQSGSGWKAAMEALCALGKDLHLTDAVVEAIGGRMDKARYKLGLAQTLTKMGTKRGHELVRDLLRHGTDEESIMTGLTVLPEWKDPEDQDLARPLFRNPNPTIRREAASGAMRFGDMGAVPDLIDLLGDDNAGVKSNAHAALKQLTKQPLGPDPDVWKTWWEGGGKDALTGKSEK
jgi:hypothetical protein